MSTVELLALFADPSRLQELSLSQKMIASLVTTLLGMGITFLALIVLQLAIIIMGRLASITACPRGKGEGGIEKAECQVAGNEPGEICEEVVAAITVSLAVLLERPPNALVIRNIRKVEKSAVAWNKAGLAEQMHDTA